MSSYYNFVAQEVAIDAIAIDDLVLVHDTSSATIKKATVAQLANRVVAAASTGTTFSNNGISVISSSIAGAYTIADPIAGAEAVIFATVGSSTAGSRTVVSLSSSVVTFNSTIGAKASISFPVAAGAGVILKGLSATQWAIPHPIGIVTST